LDPSPNLILAVNREMVSCRVLSLKDKRKFVMMNARLCELSNFNVKDQFKIEEEFAGSMLVGKSSELSARPSMSGAEGGLPGQRGRLRLRRLRTGIVRCPLSAARRASATTTTMAS
jgi:hypothetical protein